MNDMIIVIPDDMYTAMKNLVKDIEKAVSIADFIERRYGITVNDDEFDELLGLVI